MRRALAIAVVFSGIWFLLPPGWAYAGEPTSAPASAPLLSVKPLPAGSAAPFDGLLVPPDLFEQYMRADIALEECRLKLEVRDRLLAAPPVPAPRGPSINWKFTGGVAVGFIVGVVVTGALTYAAVKVVQATQ